MTRDNIVIATGYNSPPRGIPSCSERYKLDKNLIKKVKHLNIEQIKNICPRKILGFKSGEGLEVCSAIHAEKNCLLSAARNGVSTKGTIMYMNAEVSACTQCFGALINAGVEELVLVKNMIYDPTIEFLIKHSNINIREFENE